MRLFRRQREWQMGQGEARIALYGSPGADEISAATVDWEGDDDTVLHVVAVYFDKILSNLARMRTEQVELLDRFEKFVNGVRKELSEQLGETFDARMEMFPIVDEPPPANPLAEIRVDVALVFERERAMAATHFKPLKGTNERVAELGLLALWDWTVLAVGGQEAVLAPVLDNLITQCAYYREHGMPGMRSLGKAPFQAMMKGTSERLANEIGAIAGITGDKFRALPEEERDRLIDEHTRRSLEALEQEEREVGDRLWAARPSADHMEAVFEAVAEEDRAKSEETIRTGRFEQATTLVFSGENTGDDDLAHLPEMPNLEDLELAGTRVTDKGLSALRGLISLDYLGLAGTAITGNGLRAFAETPLKRLDLAYTKITDADLSNLVGLNYLELLRLDGTAITDAGLEQLLNVPSLKELHVSDTAVSDVGLERLLDHPDLWIVYARRTKVSEAASEDWIINHDRVLRIESEEEEAEQRAEMDQQFADSLFEETHERYYERAGLDRPTNDDVRYALEEMRSWLGKNLDEHSRNALFTIGVRGYLWRDAERDPTRDNGNGARRSDGKTRKSIRKSLSVGQNRSADEDRGWTLFHATAQCLEDDVPVGYGSPGGSMYGSEFLWRGFDAVRTDFVERGFETPDNEQRLGFRFGVCLHDVERLLDSVQASESRRRARES